MGIYSAIGLFHLITTHPYRCHELPPPPPPPPYNRQNAFLYTIYSILEIYGNLIVENVDEYSNFYQPPLGLTNYVGVYNYMPMK